MRHSNSEGSTATKKILLTVAGFDPCGGAGIILDVATFMHSGFQGAAVVTSLTVQNTKEVKEIFCPPPDFVWAQYRALLDDMPISGIKIGMLGCLENIPIVGKILADNPGMPRVVDPVVRSTSGAWLLNERAVPELIEKIRGNATVITPNIREAELISGSVIKSVEDMKAAASLILQIAGMPCLIKGGHLENAPRDVLYDGRQFHVYEGKRLQKKVHGTGCFLSASILSSLTGGKALNEACAAAIEATRTAIEKAIPVGHGQYMISFPLQP